MSFVTVEDVNGAVFDNQGFWWYCIDLSSFDGVEEFSNVKVDFCTISRETDPHDSEEWKYTVIVDNALFANLCRFQDGDRGVFPIFASLSNGFEVTIPKSYANLKIFLYMGNLKVQSTVESGEGYLLDDVLDLNLRELGMEQTFDWYSPRARKTYHITQLLEKGYNLIKNSRDDFVGYLLVKLLKTDFQFACNQDLIVGEVNTVSLGTDTDYKPNGALVGDYETKLSVLYNDETIPVVWNSALNDYTFDLDLTDKTTEGKIRFKVIVEANDVLNHSETDVVLDCKFETIDTLEKLTNLFKIGGTGRLSSDLTLTNDLTLSKSVNLIGNDCSIDMTSHKLVIPSDLTFKAQSVGFSNGVNTLQQEPNSTVEITDCTFTDCTGFGSVVDCQVDLASLDETDDFTTKITDCVISNCDMAILHGGNLEVNGCSVIGKISNKNYPYFLYQTDGNATILNSQFDLTDNTVYDYDIEFNSCIFTCGETATVNGYSHTELQNNNLTAFFDTQRNTSTIDVKYYYSLIEDTVHLQSSKGFCHSVSNVDFVYKTNINLSRGD